MYVSVHVFSTGTVVPENLYQNVDSSALSITSGVKYPPDYLPDKNVIHVKKNRKKKGKIRFKCLHCDYLTFKKQNLIGHLRQKHEVSS